MKPQSSKEFNADVNISSKFDSMVKSNDDLPGTTPKRGNRNKPSSDMHAFRSETGTDPSNLVISTTGPIPSTRRSLRISSVNYNKKKGRDDGNIRIVDKPMKQSLPIPGYVVDDLTLVDGSYGSARFPNQRYSSPIVVVSKAFRNSGLATLCDKASRAYHETALDNHLSTFPNPKSHPIVATSKAFHDEPFSFSPNPTSRPASKAFHETGRDKLFDEYLSRENRDEAEVEPSDTSTALKVNYEMGLQLGGENVSRVKQWVPSCDLLHDDGTRYVYGTAVGECKEVSVCLHEEFACAADHRDAGQHLNSAASVARPYDDVFERTLAPFVSAENSPSMFNLSSKTSDLKSRSVKDVGIGRVASENNQAMLRKLESLLDISYRQSRVNTANGVVTTYNTHRKRVMHILDNPQRSKALVSMIIRNKQDIEYTELMAEFDRFW